MQDQGGLADLACPWVRAGVRAHAGDLFPDPLWRRGVLQHDLEALLDPFPWRRRRVEEGREHARVLPVSLSGEANRGSAVLPKAVERSVFPWHQIVLYTLAGSCLSALAVAALAGAFRRKVLVYTSLGVVIAAVVATLADLMYAAGDYVRYGIQEAVFSRIAIVLMAMAAIDALIARPRGEATARALARARYRWALPRPARAGRYISPRSG
jgi:hypothetical protein